MNPGPALVGDVPFAITGSVVSDGATGLSFLRLYMWRVGNIRPLISDELVAFDRESANMIIPFMLDWLLEWIDADQPARLTRNWLYAGARLGWNLQMFDPLWSTQGFDGLQWESFSLAVSANGQFLNPLGFLFLGAQVEGILSYDLGSYAMSFEIPVLGRVTARTENSFLALLFGPHLFLPITFDGQEVRQVAHRTDRLFGNAGWGYSLGFGMGTRVGPGFLNLGLRWSNDMFSSRRPADDGAFYNRRTITVSIGYELGFFRRD